MQIREKGQKLLLIRNTYNPEKKRSDSRTIASLPYFITEMPDDADISELTDDERAQLAEYLATAKARREAHKKLSAMGGGANKIREIASGVADDVTAEQLTQEMAANMYAAMDELAKALRKRGFGKRESLALLEGQE